MRVPARARAIAGAAPATIGRTLRGVVRVVDRHDVMIFAGLGLLMYGLQLVSAPLAFIVGGSLLFVAGVLSHIVRPIREPRLRVEKRSKTA